MKPKSTINFPPCLLVLADYLLPSFDPLCVTTSFCLRTNNHDDYRNKLSSFNTHFSGFFDSLYSLDLTQQVSLDSCLDQFSLFLPPKKLKLFVDEFFIICLYAVFTHAEFLRFSDLLPPSFRSQSPL